MKKLIPENKSVVILSKIKKIIRCNIVKTVNSFLDSGDWILIDVERSHKRPMYVLGMFKETEENQSNSKKF